MNKSLVTKQLEYFSEIQNRIRTVNKETQDRISNLHKLQMEILQKYSVKKL